MFCHEKKLTGHKLYEILFLQRSQFHHFKGLFQTLKRRCLSKKHSRFQMLKHWENQTTFTTATFSVKIRENWHIHGVLCHPSAAPNSPKSTVARNIPTFRQRLMESIGTSRMPRSKQLTVGRVGYLRVCVLYVVLYMLYARRVLFVVALSRVSCMFRVRCRAWCECRVFSKMLQQNIPMTYRKNEKTYHAIPQTNANMKQKKNIPKNNRPQHTNPVPHDNEHIPLSYHSNTTNIPQATNTDHSTPHKSGMKVVCRRFEIYVLTTCSHERVCRDNL